MKSTSMVRAIGVTVICALGLVTFLAGWHLRENVSRGDLQPFQEEPDGVRPGPSGGPSRGGGEWTVDENGYGVPPR